MYVPGDYSVCPNSSTARKFAESYNAALGHGRNALNNLNQNGIYVRQRSGSGRDYRGLRCILFDNGHGRSDKRSESRSNGLNATSDRTTSPMVVPLVLNQHLLAQWLFFLYCAIVYYPNGCSSCTLTSFTGTMLVPPIVKHHLLVQRLFLFLLYSFIMYDTMVVYTTIIYWPNGCSVYSLTSFTGPMVLPLILYHHLLVQWLILL